MVFLFFLLFCKFTTYSFQQSEEFAECSIIYTETVKLILIE